MWKRERWPRERWPRKRWPVLAAAVLLASAATFAQSPRFGVGRTPTAEDTRLLGVMVAPDGYVITDFASMTNVN